MRTGRPNVAMNRLPAAGDEGWLLPRHAHVVVFDAGDDRHLLTIYDCGAAQNPPRAQLRGHLVRVQADHVVEPTPTGYIAKLREPGRLQRQSRDPDHYVIRPAGTTES